MVAPQLTQESTQPISNTLIDHESSTEGFSETRSVHSLGSIDSGIEPSNAQTVDLDGIPKTTELRAWATKHNITQIAIYDLLRLLRCWYPNECLPRDARTLLCTPRSVNLEELDAGQYFYFGVRENLIRSVSQGLKMCKFQISSHLKICQAIIY